MHSGWRHLLHKVQTPPDVLHSSKTSSSSWTARIAACGRCGSIQDAVGLLDEMEQQGVVPDQTTLLVALNLCSNHGVLAAGISVHEKIQKYGLQNNVIVANGLVNFYGKCGKLDLAKGMFDTMLYRDPVSWNTMVAAYTQNGHYNDAVSLFFAMQLEGIKTGKIGLVTLLKACCHSKFLRCGRFFHLCLAEDGLDRVDATAGTSLVHMYSKCGSLEQAREIFQKMSYRNKFAWSAMIGAFVQHQDGQSALECFHWMLLDGVEPDEISFVAVLEACNSLRSGRLVHGLIRERGLDNLSVVGSALVTMYGKCGSGHESKRVFQCLNHPNAIVWSSIIAALAGQPSEQQQLEALRFLRLMQLESSARPNNVTLVAALNACSSPTALRQGREINSLAVECGYNTSDKIVGNALVNMFARCGSLSEAREAFSGISAKDATAWNALITVYAQHQQGKLALQTLKLMLLEGHHPNKHTFVNSLVACTDTSSLKVGREVHGWIRDAGLEPDLLLGNALLNLYSKCGSLTSADEIFLRLRASDVVTWNAMIGAYARHGHPERTLKLFRLMQAGGTRANSVTFVSVLSACSHAGLVEDAHCSFVSMECDHGVVRSSKHYVCMVDLLGRAGKFEEMFRFVRSSPVEADAVVWRAVVAACRGHGRVEFGNRAVKRLLELEPGSQTAYTALVHHYSF